MFTGGLSQEEMRLWAESGVPGVRPRDYVGAPCFVWRRMGTNGRAPLENISAKEACACEIPTTGPLNGVPLTRTFPAY